MEFFKEPLKQEDLPHYTYEDYVQWEGQWFLVLHGFLNPIDDISIS